MSNTHPVFQAILDGICPPAEALDFDAIAADDARAFDGDVDVPLSVRDEDAKTWHARAAQ